MAAGGRDHAAGAPGLPLVDLYALILLFRAPGDARLLSCGMAELGVAASATAVGATLATLRAAGLVRACAAADGVHEITGDGEDHLRAAMGVVRRLRDALLAQSVQGASRPDPPAAAAAAPAPCAAARDRRLRERLGQADAVADSPATSRVARRSTSRTAAESG